MVLYFFGAESWMGFVYMCQGKKKTPCIGDGNPTF